MPPCSKPSSHLSSREKIRRERERSTSERERERKRERGIGGRTVKRRKSRPHAQRQQEKKLVSPLARSRRGESEREVMRILLGSTVRSFSASRSLTLTPSLTACTRSHALLPDRYRVRQRGSEAGRALSQEFSADNKVGVGACV